MSDVINKNATNNPNYRAGAVPVGDRRTPVNENDDTDTNEQEATNTNEDSNNTQSEDDDFVSIDSLPDNLKGIGKKMLDSRRKAAERDKAKLASERESLANEFAGHVQRSNALARLMQLPQFQQFWADVEGGKPYGHSAKASGSSNEETEDDDAPMSRKDIAAMIEQGIQRGLSAGMAPFHRSQAAQQLDNLKALVKEETGDTKLFDLKRPALVEYLDANPNTDLPKALWAVAGEELSKARVAKAIAEAQGQGEELGKKRLRTEKPSGTGVGDISSKPAKKYDRPHDAVRDVIREMMGSN